MAKPASLVGEKLPVASSTDPTPPNSLQAQEPNRAVSLGKAERIVNWLRNGKQHWSIRVSAVAFSAIALVVAGAAADLPFEGIAVVAISITIYAVIVWRRLAHQEAIEQRFNLAVTSSSPWAPEKGSKWSSSDQSLFDQIVGDSKNPLLEEWNSFANRGGFSS